MNDCEGILKRLRAGMPEGISTIEGSFAGDILGAVANELGKFYSMDIETIGEKAFVSSAGGQWLDLACSNWGESRRSIGGILEEDESLRQRTLESIRNRGAAGSISDYIRWAKEIEGVGIVQVEPIKRGGGTVNVYVGATDSGTVERVRGHLKKMAPVGADLLVDTCNPRVLPISCILRLAPSADLAVVTQQVRVKILEHFGGQPQDGTAYSIGNGVICGLICSVPGVLDVVNLKVDGKSISFKLNFREYPTIGDFDISRFSEEV